MAAGKDCREGENEEEEGVAHVDEHIHRFKPVWVHGFGKAEGGAVQNPVDTEGEDGEGAVRLVARGEVVGQGLPPAVVAEHLKERVAVLGHVGVVPFEVVVGGCRGGGIGGGMAWGGRRCGVDAEDRRVEGYRG